MKGKLKKISNNLNYLTKEGAYILSVIGPGDGFVRGDETSIGLAVSDEDFSLNFKDAIERFYGLKCKKYVNNPTGFGKKKRYRVALYSKEVARDLKKLNTDFSEGAWRVPMILKKANNLIKAAYIKGFADSQGCVGKREIVIASKNKVGITEIKELFSSFGIEPTIQGKKNTFLLSISGRTQLQLFYDNIGFSISRKQKKLKEVLNNYKRYTTPKRIVRKLEPNIVKLLNKGYSQRKVARELNISISPVRRVIKEGL